jgi:hypothetical protein
MSGIVERGPYRGTRFPKRQINPSVGQQRLRCGHCGGMDFEVHVRPVLSACRVTALVCLGCLKPRSVDQHGFIEGSGVTTVNARDDFIKPPPHSGDTRRMTNGE